MNTNQCCGSKCPKCWTEEDSNDLYYSLIEGEMKRLLRDEITAEVYQHNILKINKNDKP